MIASFFSRPIDDIDLPELPDFLKPKPSTARPLIPIQDIDLPDGASVIQPDESEIEEPKEEEGKWIKKGLVRILSSAVLFVFH